MTEKQLFQAMTEAIEEKNQKELDYLLAKRNADRLTDMYRTLVGAQERCIKCGNRIEDYEDVEYTEDKVLKTYRCPHCGFYGTQICEIIYSQTEEVK